MGWNLNNFSRIHEESLKWRGERSGLIARNIANANTPGYKARDVNFSQLLNRLDDPDVHSVHLDATHAQHVNFNDQGIAETDLMYRTPMHPSFDGNTVDTQLEYAAFSDNSLRYMASFTFMNQKIKNLMSALQGG